MKNKIFGELGYLKKEYLYCTACLDIDVKLDFDFVFQKFQEFAVLTEKEQGCIGFFVVPKDSAHQLILWEVWKNEEAFYSHHKAAHTIKLANENITSIKWFDSSAPIDF